MSAPNIDTNTCIVLLSLMIPLFWLSLA